MQLSEKKITSTKLKIGLSRFFGFPLVFFFGLCMIICFFTADDLFSAIVAPLLLLPFTAFGGWLIFCASKHSKFLHECERYAAAMKDYSCASVDVLSAILQTDNETVKRNLAEMIHRGFTTNVSLDLVSNTVTVFEVHEETFEAEEDDVVFEEEEEEKIEIDCIEDDCIKVNVVCPACLGITMLPIDSVGVCDFCNSKIQS